MMKKKSLHTLLDWFGHGYSCVSCELLEDWGAGCALIPFYFLPPFLCYSKLSWHSSRTPPSSERAEKLNSTLEELRKAGGVREGEREGMGLGGQGATSGREERARRRWKGSNTFMSGLTDRLSLFSSDGEQQSGKQERCWNKTSSERFCSNLKVVFCNPARLGVPANNRQLDLCSCLLKFW